MHVIKIPHKEELGQYVCLLECIVISPYLFVYEITIKLDKDHTASAHLKCLMTNSSLLSQFHCSWTR